MELQSKRPTAKGPAETFTGEVWVETITQGTPPSRLGANLVRFSPGARSAWHSHPVGQTLYVTEGQGLAQTRGGQRVELHPGDVLVTPPGEEHWHGAAPDHFMTHLSLVEADESGTAATWGAHVTDAEYGGPAPA